MARLLRFAPLIATFALAACGGGDDGPRDDASPSCQTVTVNIGEFVFDPTPVALKACDSVVWHNTHTQAHTSTGNGAKTWGTGNIAPGDRSEPVTFGDAGDFTYICALHPFMEGQVRVSA